VPVMPDLINNSRTRSNIEIYKNIMNDIYDASKYYQKAAEASLKENKICNACSLSMKCLYEMLDYMLAVTRQEKVEKLENEIEKWKEDLSKCKMIYMGNEKGENFIQSLYQMITCIEKLDKYKKYAMWKEEKTFEECIKKLNEITKNTEGPLQKIIDDSAKQMDICKSKIISYKGTETKHFLDIDKIQDLESKNPIESETNPVFLSPKNKLPPGSNWIGNYPIKMIIQILIAVIATVIASIIERKYFP